MEKDFLVGLAKKIYYLTVLFPKKEPLRYKIREVVLEILQKPDEHDFETLNIFLELAKDQNWVKREDILAIQKEYADLSEEIVNPKQEKLFKQVTVQEINKVIIPEIQSSPADNAADATNTTGEKIKTELNFQPLTAKTLIERQEKILSILREKGKAQVWEIKKVFPQVSKRTLRRDFEFLFKQGIIDRIGEKNNTYYQVKTG